MAFQVTIFSDYICPFCFVGKGVFQQLQQEFPIEATWRNIEIHPETPEGGIALADKFPGMDLQATFDNLRRAGAPYGIQFGQVDRMPNSRLAIAASEFARDHSSFEAFHARVFAAYFTEGRDIGELDVLLDIAREIGLDVEALKAALATNAYQERMQAAQEEAYRSGVSGTPTFLINGKYRLVGAQPIESFRNALKRIEEEASRG